MLSRAVKASYYAVARPAMWLSGELYRGLRAPRSGNNRVHLGPGQGRYLPNWINVDANIFTARTDVWSDLRHRLPFRDGTINAFYSHHVIEHLPDLAQHFAEVYRCLSPGGMYRVAGPNGDNAMRKFFENDTGWFGDWPDKRKSIGGRLNNFILCKNEHLAILTESYMRELMMDAGFENLAICAPTSETRAPELFGDCLPTEHETDFACPHTLVVEGVK